jgi:hypothetical protein
MRGKTSSKGLKLALSLAIVVAMITVYPLWSDASATGRNACSRFSQPPTTRVPAQATDVVIEWNQQAAALAVLPASALAPVTGKSHTRP